MVDQNSVMQLVALLEAAKAAEGGDQQQAPQYAPQEQSNPFGVLGAPQGVGGPEQANDWSNMQFRQGLQGGGGMPVDANGQQAYAAGAQAAQPQPQVAPAPDPHAEALAALQQVIAQQSRGARGIQ